MKSCNGCKNAEWFTDSRGKLHKSGEGRCSVNIDLPDLPKSMMWSANSTKPFIVRFTITKSNVFEADCVYYEEINEDDKDSRI